MDLKKILKKAFDAGYDTSVMYNCGDGNAYEDFESFYRGEIKQLNLTDVVSSKLNDWVKIDPTKANTIPEKPVWVMTIDSKEIEYKEADEYIELNYASHYRLIDKPEPPL